MTRMTRMTVRNDRGNKFGMTVDVIPEAREWSEESIHSPPRLSPNSEF